MVTDGTIGVFLLSYPTSNDGNFKGFHHGGFVTPSHRRLEIP